MHAYLTVLILVDDHKHWPQVLYFIVIHIGGHLHITHFSKNWILAIRPIFKFFNKCTLLRLCYRLFLNPRFEKRKPWMGEGLTGGNTFERIFHKQLLQHVLCFRRDILQNRIHIYPDVFL